MRERVRRQTQSHSFIRRHGPAPLVQRCCCSWRDRRPDGALGCAAGTID
jgi:hypothetical protein